MSGKILVLGASGQVGSALLRQLGDDAIVLRVDFLSENFTSALNGLPIRAVINAAAYTQVDKAESDREQAMRINGVAVGELALWCKNQKIPLVHFSTDYMFDGSGAHFRSEEEMVAPLSVYGESKLLGELLIMASGVDYLIFRTSWVYDAWGKNFANTMRRLFLERESVSVVNDQIGAPTYAPQLADATIAALNQAFLAKTFPSGIYHLCHGGQVSWFGFAQAIFALASAHESGIKCKLIQPITTAEYPTPAKRPLNSRLDCSKAKQVLSVALPDWAIGLQMWEKEIYATDTNTTA